MSMLKSKNSMYCNIEMNWVNPTPKHVLSQEAKQGSQAWIHEVKAIQLAQGVTYKEALYLASARRKDNIPFYRTMNERYLDRLDQTRKTKKPYRYSGNKNKRPVTMNVAEKITARYYRDRADQYRDPLAAMKKNITSCHKNPKRTLIACQADGIGRPIVTQECANSWKYRPGKYSKSPTGPGYYDIHGLTDLCGPQNQEKLKQSKLYNRKFIRKKV
jgi:hypothetical protein